MKRNRAWSVLGAAAALLTAGSLQANITPIPITAGSFNQDVVVEATAPATTAGERGAITATMDNGTAKSGTPATLTGGTWYEKGYNPGSPTSGLPAAGTTITSLNDSKAGAIPHSFTLPPSWTANNVLLLDTANRTGTITFATPTAANTISFLTDTGNGSIAKIDAIIHRQDGSTFGTQFGSPDWFNNNPTVFSAMGRIGDVAASSFTGTTGSFDTQPSLTNPAPGNPRLYQEDAGVAGSASPITSIDLIWRGSGNSHTVIFAVSGGADIVPEPASLSLLGLGGLGLLARRRRAV